MKTKFLAVLVIAACAATASAADIRVDIEDSATDPAGNWNILGDVGSLTNLVDYGTGAGTGVNLVVAGDMQTSSQSTEWDPSNPGPAWLDANKDAAMDYFYISSTTQGVVGTATFENLTPGQAYRVELIASSDSTNHGDAQYSVNGVFFDGSSDGLYDFEDGYVNGSWLVWSSVNADGDGKLVIEIDTIDSSGRGRINALQLTTAAVPEPTSMALLGLGALGLIRRRRTR